MAPDAIGPHGAPLPAGVRASMEEFFGEELGDVRLHSGPAAHLSARSFGARAYTRGRDIVLGQDVSIANLSRSSPRSLLAHELTHVLQHRRSGLVDPGDRIAPSNGLMEREARLNGLLIARGLPAGRVRGAAEGIALTPTSVSVEQDLSYSINDWEVTPADEARILKALEADSDLSATIVDLDKSDMLEELLDRVDEPANRKSLLNLLGARLSATARALVEPFVRQLGIGEELQFNLGRLGLTSKAAPFDATPLEQSLIGTSKTSGGHLTDAFTGVGATGVSPANLEDIPLADQARLALRDPETTATYINPAADDLFGYLDAIGPTKRTKQAELLLKRPIASVEAASYAGNLPSRMQVFKAAAGAHDLHAPLVAAFTLAEQRDQTQAEDAKDYQGATSILAPDLSIGLGQVVISTAQKGDLFADLVTSPTRTTRGLNRFSLYGHDIVAKLLASDEFNIFASARYIRQVANKGSKMSPAALPNTAAAYPGIDFAAYAENSHKWPADNIRALGSEYTSRDWDDELVEGWGEFVYQAYLDVVSTKLL
jgi:Domain of unknown function (DUF4157)